MTKSQKNELVNQLTAEFKASNAVVASEYKGSKVSQLEVIRNEARTQGIKIKVVKNTLGMIALKNAGIEDITLKDTNILVWGEDQLAVCKLIAKYSDQYDAIKIKSASLEGKISTPETVIALSKLPSKNELIGMLLSVWTAPARMFVTGLDELRKQKEAA
jgi:large subunit ribosomal protein L10